MMTKTTGRTAFLQLLADEGVTHLFGNPGTTELAIMEVVPDFPQLRFVLGLQESVVLGMADGFCRASGRLAAANVHVMPGLGNAMGALYNAKFSGSPVILTAGQQEQGHGLLGEVTDHDREMGVPGVGRPRGPCVHACRQQRGVETAERANLVVGLQSAPEEQVRRVGSQLVARPLHIHITVRSAQMPPCSWTRPRTRREFEDGIESEI